MQTETPDVVLVSSNLFGSSRISGVVRGHDLTIRVVRDADQLAKLVSDQLAAVLIDLDEAADLEALSQCLSDDVQRIAFGPHVDTEKLAAAAQAGWQVLTRGQFDATLADLVAKWAR